MTLKTRQAYLVENHSRIIILTLDKCFIFIISKNVRNNPTSLHIFFLFVGFLFILDKM